MATWNEIVFSDPSRLTSLLSDLAVDPTTPPRTYRRLQAIWGRRVEDGIELSYLASSEAREPYRLWRLLVPPGVSVPSLALLIPSAGSYEREISDLYGVEFEGAPDTRRFVLHEGARVPAAFLERQSQYSTPFEFASTALTMPTVGDANLQQLRFGPVRADVVESASFQFSYAGEGIVHLETRLFYKHRGMETRFEGKLPHQGAPLAERVSGIDSAAHAFAFALACEDALEISVPKRAQQLRALLAELERLYNHLQYFGLLSKLTTLKVADAEGHYVGELAKQLNARLTGSRFLRGLIVPGGLRRDLDTDGLKEELAELEERARTYLNALSGTRSYLDRLETTGVLGTQMALAQGATGPIERASGLDRDLRRDHPYSGYGDLQFIVPDASAGDARARALIREYEIFASFAIIGQLANQLVDGPVMADSNRTGIPDAVEGLGWVEATRGTLIYAVYLDHGKLSRVKIKEPSFSNWRVFPYTVDGTNMMDYAINEASFGLSLAGNDR
ncbi:nickel-dependent hydrogenase large subunit [Ferrimicrobium acidiphilum]|uniref:hydrogenase large subunit n=1 Tax=Ferrimicrobium acidiphilum TaxID=121039 RepID=UPI0023F24B51|nr:nickel-dependent hydrogenase large subunit [Ferrimicrobium acidiphilum]